MAKKILLFIIALSFFGPTFSPGLFLKTALAQAATINNLVITDAGAQNYAGQTRDYTVDFDLGAAALPAAIGEIHIKFHQASGPDFSFSNMTSAGGGNPQLNCTTQIASQQITCKNISTSDVAANSHISIRVRQVKNPATPGPYSINVDSTAGGSASRSVTVTAPQQTAPASANYDTNFWPDSGCWFWEVGCWLEYMLTFIPKLIINIAIFIVRVIVGEFIKVIINIGVAILNFSIDLNNSL